MGEFLLCFFVGEKKEKGKFICRSNLQEIWEAAWLAIFNVFWSALQRSSRCRQSKPPF